MRALRWSVAAVGTIVLVVTPLLFLDGSNRTAGFRFGVALLTAFTLRAVARGTAEANAAPTDSPFARRSADGPPRRPLRARLRRSGGPPRRSPADSLVVGGIAGAGPFHNRLRPALRDIADERLRAHHGIGIDDPSAAGWLGPTAWDLLRPDRPAPDDRRAPGPDAATMDAVLTAIEGL